MSAAAIRWPDPGEMDRRVTVRRWTSQANVDMGIDETFDAGLERWAKIEPVGGALFWGEQQVEEKPTHRIFLRAGAGTRHNDITGQHVIDHTAENMRYRVLRSMNASGAGAFTVLEVKLLGNIA